MKTRYKDLSIELKVGIVFAYFFGIINLVAFVIGFIGGLFS